MDRLRTLTALLLVLLAMNSIPAADREVSPVPPKPKANDPEEPLAKQLSFEKAAQFLDGFVVYVLRQAGVSASDEGSRKGKKWLESNQRESGRWFTRSLNTDNYHFISHA